MKKVFALSFILALVICGGAFAHGHNSSHHYHDHEERYVREEAARRNMTLITVERAKEIATRRLNTTNVRFKEIELEDKADKYPNDINFRPVYEIECLCSRGEYDIKIDALTGEILKFKLDD